LASLLTLSFWAPNRTNANTTSWVWPRPAWKPAVRYLAQPRRKPPGECDFRRPDPRTLAASGIKSFRKECLSHNEKQTPCAAMLTI